MTRRVLVGLGLAASLWAGVFQGKRGTFWARMSPAAAALGLYALWARPELRQERVRLADLGPGAASAAGLYLIFQVGDRLARRFMPAGPEEIASIYRLRSDAWRPLIGALLAGVIGPAEELFWRGLVQKTLIEELGAVTGTLAATAAYGGVHLVSANLTLTGAAATAGVYWGGQYAWQGRLGPVLVSHVLWDVWIFLIAPTPGALGPDRSHRSPRRLLD